MANAYGLSGGGTVSESDIWQAVIADVNKSGGVLGRKLALHIHSFDASTYIANPSQTYGEICGDFRDDHKVFVALMAIADPSLRSCLAQMGSPLVVVDGGLTSILPAAAYAEHDGDYLFGPDSITNERLAELFIPSLLDRAYAERWDTAVGAPGGVAPVKLGLIHVDTPDTNHLYEQYAKELAKHGLKFDDTFTYAQNAQAALAATQSAVLKFHSDGITHVFGASSFFMQEAENQGYRPRYAHQPGWGQVGADNAPAAQLKGALTVGWLPTTDVPSAKDPGDTPAGEHCRAVMNAAGLTAGNRTDLATMYSVCDAVYAFRAALTAGRIASVPGLRRGFESLGAGFLPASTFGAHLGPGRHNGVDVVRDMAFDSACPCLTYTSTANRS